MTDTLEDAEKEARASAADNGVTRLADHLGRNASASAVFGALVERDGVTVIPVARVRWGVGGGRGRRKGQTDDGFGGGGGVQAAPLGFIEVRDGVARYRRIRDPLRVAIAALLLPLSFSAAGAVMFVTLAALARSMKGMFAVPQARWPSRRRRA
jgi:uncharacterized spore protein YtfJ